MPALTNQRQERFCQLIKRGIPPFRAYPMAGYKAHNGEPYRLRDNPRVKRRIAELTRHIAMKTRVTVESITDELNAVALNATADKQHGAARSAIETKAKLHGLLVDRKESGAPGDFAGLQSADEVLALVRKELGDATADALAAVLTKHDPEAVETTVDLQAIDVTRDADSALN